MPTLPQPIAYWGKNNVPALLLLLLLLTLLTSTV
jgi:hypothetical protein